MLRSAQAARVSLRPATACRSRSSWRARPRRVRGCRPSLGIYTRAMLRALAFFVLCVPGAQAAEHMLLWHALDKPMTAQLERLALAYNAAQQEFEVELMRVPRAPAKAVRIALPLNTARPVLYYNRDAFRRAKLNPRRPPQTWYAMASVLGSLVASG